MAFIVEDGSGVADANSYTSVAELDDYAEYRIDATQYASYSTAQKEAALVVASSDWLDGQHSLRGTKLNEDQGLHFPTDIDGFPDDIKTASMKAALLQLQGLLLVDLSVVSVSGEVESESKAVGPLSKSVTYRSGSSQRYSRILPKDLTNLLKPYLLAGGLGVVYRL